MVLMLGSLRLVFEVLEAWQVKLTAQVELVCRDRLRVLTELIQGLNGTR